MDVTLVAALVAAVSVLAAVLKSVHRIGPAEVGLVIKNLGFKKLHDDDPIAFGGEAGYQAELLMAGLRFRFWPVFSVSRFPWVQVPAGETGVVIAQVGQPLPIGNKSAVYKPEFGNFSDVADFISNGGEKGVQRPVPPPGTLVPIHPRGLRGGHLARGVRPAGVTGAGHPGPGRHPRPAVLRAHARAATGGGDRAAGRQRRDRARHHAGGCAADKGDIASRLGSFDDVAALEEGDAGGTDAELIDMLLGSKNVVHNNYQDFQAFIDAGGRIGLQHDPLLYGAYLLNRSSSASSWCRCWW